ncbi:MAG: hypothetical protein HQL07_17665 [Nitrospirae bacterium]|nr:hypothetical protein [Magnetococcales bacterium]HAT49065.1 hypothetical protein [Alphaproteobacteria bacterium]
MDIASVVERLIQERGQLDPLVFLQEIQVVSKTGLATWRQGKVASLQDVLQGDPLWIDGCLRQAARMARTLGLTPRTVEACRTDTHGHRQGLQISTLHDPGREALYTTHYQRPKTGHGGTQMDLFLDTPETMLINDLILAIADHNAPVADELVKRLAENHPQNGALEELHPLIQAITQKEHLAHTPMEGIQIIQDEIVPCAQQTLAALAGRYLKPFYRLFDRALMHQPFDPQHPNAHRSWTLEQLENWKALAECVLLEEGWVRQPVLLQRRAKALFQLKRLEASHQVWVQFFWGFPQQAAQAIESQGDKNLKRLWYDFIDRVEHRENDAQTFPAWMLIHQPRLAEQREEWLEEADGETPLPEKTAFFLLADLLRTERESPASPDSLALRYQLKERFPELFSLFMGTIRSQSA